MSAEVTNSVKKEIDKKPLETGLEEKIAENGDANAAAADATKKKKKKNKNKSKATGDEEIADVNDVKVLTKDLEKAKIGKNPFHDYYFRHVISVISAFYLNLKCS